MNKSLKKTRIYKDQAKDRHTTHWDLDYLPREEVESLYADSKKKKGGSEPEIEKNPGRIGWTLIIAGVALLILALLLVRFTI